MLFTLTCNEFIILKELTFKIFTFPMGMWYVFPIKKFVNKRVQRDPETKELENS